jgi:hypothetical protein
MYSCRIAFINWEFLTYEHREKILLGVDDSEFALQAVAAVGGLLKNSKDCGIILFYGSPDPNLPFLSKALARIFHESFLN